MASIGERIKQRRAELKAAGKDISVQQIADAADISRSAVYQWGDTTQKLKATANAICKQAGLPKQF